MTNPSPARDKLIYIARESCSLLLKEQGTVLPWGFTIDALGKEPRTYFPRDQHPKSDWNGLIDALVAELRRRVDEGEDVAAAVMVSLIESGGSKAVVLQIETPSTTEMYTCPLVRKATGWIVGEAKPTDDRNSQFFDGVFPLP